MREITYENSIAHNTYPFLVVKDRLINGEPAGWRVEADVGYVFYDLEAHDTMLNQETMEEIPITYYYRVRYFPRNYDWDKFSLFAVAESGVPQEQIF